MQNGRNGVRHHHSRKTRRTRIASRSRESDKEQRSFPLDFLRNLCDREMSSECGRMWGLNLVSNRSYAPGTADESVPVPYCTSGR